jgi:predicted nucleic acid-binding protein
VKHTGEQIIYLDTSALVKLVIQEDESARLNDDLRSRDRKIVSAWCLTELASVLMKRVRSNSLVSKKAREAYDRTGVCT